MEEKIQIGKMNIIIFCKSNDLFSNFYNQNNIGPSSIKIDILENKIDYQIRKSKNLDWLFIELGSNDFNKMIENTYNFITYNYNNKNIDGESVIIVFLKNGNNDELNLITFFEQKSRLKRPKLLFISNDKNKQFYSKFIIDNELDYDERDIEILKEEELNIQLNEKLINYYKYYNQIGDDEIINSKINSNNIEINLPFTLNFFVTGKPGSGKSTLINLLLNEKRAKETTGKNTTNKIIKFNKRNSSLSFYDTPGFISGNDVDSTIKIIKSKVQQMDIYKEKIHGILYVLNSRLVRTIDENEIDFINFLLSYEIPIFFVLNFSSPKKKKSQIFFKRFLEEISVIFSKICFLNNVFQVNLKKDFDGNEIYGIDKLMEGIYNYYLPHKLDINLLHDNLTEKEMFNIISKSIFFSHLKKKEDIMAHAKFWSEVTIKSMAVIGAIVGFTHFLPFSDLPLLAGIELSLITSILGIYGIKRNTSEKKKIIKESAKSGVIVTGICSAGYFLANILKTIPFIGQIPGGLIDAVIAGISINQIGESTIHYCQKLFKQNIMINYIKNAAESINKGIDELLNIAKDFRS